MDGARGAAVGAALDCSVVGLFAWREAEWARLAARRCDMAAVPLADDATRRGLWAGRPADQMAALRTVVLGGAVPQNVVAHWSHAAGCPHCGGRRDPRAPHVGLPTLGGPPRAGVVPKYEAMFDVRVACMCGSLRDGNAGPGAHPAIHEPWPLSGAWRDVGEPGRGFARAGAAALRADRPRAARGPVRRSHL